jgi:hypothetical protein
MATENLFLAADKHEDSNNVASISDMFARNGIVQKTTAPPRRVTDLCCALLANESPDGCHSEAAWRCGDGACSRMKLHYNRRVCKRGFDADNVKYKNKKKTKFTAKPISN